ncbi:hypothetical protein MRX96_052237 [Rhipicephalus microplus]
MDTGATEVGGPALAYISAAGKRGAWCALVTVATRRRGPAAARRTSFGAERAFFAHRALNCAVSGTRLNREHGRRAAVRDLRRRGCCDARHRSDYG